MAVAAAGDDRSPRLDLGARLSLGVKVSLLSLEVERTSTVSLIASSEASSAAAVSAWNALALALEMALRICRSLKTLCYIYVSKSKLRSQS